VRILVVAAVAAIVAVVVVLVLKKVDGPWSGDSSIRTAVAGAFSGVVSVYVANNLRKRD
jgi:hypothetical protein